MVAGLVEAGEAFLKALEQRLQRSDVSGRFVDLLRQRALQ
jgi:hypothetical protein